MDNDILLKLAKYLNKDIENYSENDVSSLLSLVDEKEAINLLLQSFLDTKYDFKNSIEQLKIDDYNNNPYLNIFNKPIRFKNWQMKYLTYKPYELFVCDNFKEVNGEVVPSLGYFNKPFKYLTILENNNEWMSLKPNEINTMKKDISDAFGNVLVAGLGMGYFTYMISLKEEVSSITAIEKDINVIKLFKMFILPNFKFKDKINIINADFIEYTNNNILNYDYCYIDIYHDVSDGLEFYKKLRGLRDKYTTMTTRFWIEETMKYYL